MNKLAILALESERTKKLKWYNIFRKKYMTEFFLFGESRSEITVIFSKNNFSHIGNIIKSNGISHVIMTSEFKRNFKDLITLPEQTVLIDGKDFFIELIPEIIRKLIKLSVYSLSDSLAIDTSSQRLAKNIFDILNPMFREIIFISNSGQDTFFENIAEEYGIPSSTKKTDDTIKSCIAVKTGTDKINFSKKTLIFDLSGDIKTDSSSRIVNSAEITIPYSLPYKIKEIELAEFLKLNEEKLKYKLISLLYFDDIVPISQLIKKD